MSDIITQSTSSDISSVSSVKNVIEFEFVLENGKDGITTVSDELLDTKERAAERANSEFLNNAFKKKQIKFGTQRTDLNINTVILLHGLKYIVKAVDVAINDKSIISNITALRYEE